MFFRPSSARRGAIDPKPPPIGLWAFMSTYVIGGVVDGVGVRPLDSKTCIFGFFIKLLWPPKRSSEPSGDFASEASQTPLMAVSGLFAVNVAPLGGPGGPSSVSINM